MTPNELALSVVGRILQTRKRLGAANGAGKLLDKAETLTVCDAAVAAIDAGSLLTPTSTPSAGDSLGYLVALLTGDSFGSLDDPWSRVDALAAVGDALAVALVACRCRMRVDAGERPTTLDVACAAGVTPARVRQAVAAGEMRSPEGRRRAGTTYHPDVARAWLSGRGVAGYP